jgi:hypothetical protein
VSDPRELDVPPVGWLEIVDPSTGRRREVRVTPAVQRRFAEVTARRAEERLAGFRRAGAEVVDLSTDADWLAEIVRHVQQRRVQAVRGGVLRR